VVTVSASPNIGYQFTGFTGDLGGTINPQNLTMNGPKAVTANFTPTPTTTVTITSSPEGLSVVVDGSTYTTPHSFQWNNGSDHTVKVNAQQSLLDTPYLFLNWSDGKPRSRSLKAPETPTTYTAYFEQRVIIGTGGIYPSQLEVNLGDLPVDKYDDATDGSNLNADFPQCPGGGGWTVLACMEYFLSKYARQGVTGVRFQFNVLKEPSVAFDIGTKAVKADWVANLTRFFEDLAEFGITKITPTPSWNDYNNSPVYVDSCAAIPEGTVCQAYPANCTEAGTGRRGRNLRFYPLVPFGFEGADADGWDSNEAWACSPQPTINTEFWGWQPHYWLIYNIAAAAHSKGLLMQEFDLENEVNLYHQTLKARWIYDNVTTTPVFSYLGGALAAGSGGAYDSRLLTVSVITDSPATLPQCASLYGDAAGLIYSSELLAATGGAPFGRPPYERSTYNGAMVCDSTNDLPPPVGCLGLSGDDWWQCAIGNMPTIPTQQSTPIVTDMHNKPCAWGVSDCDWGGNSTDIDKEVLSGISDFLACRYLTGNTIIFGETWSNTNTLCNGHADQTVTTQMIGGYSQSCLYNAQNPGCSTRVPACRPS
jgi:hypothetical protein